MVLLPGAKMEDSTKKVSDKGDEHDFRMPAASLSRRWRRGFVPEALCNFNFAVAAAADATFGWREESRWID